jgi:predicted small metal-binding protein
LPFGDVDWYAVPRKNPLPILLRDITVFRKQQTIRARLKVREHESALAVRGRNGIVASAVWRRRKITLVLKLRVGFSSGGGLPGILDQCRDSHGRSPWAMRTGAMSAHLPGAFSQPKSNAIIMNSKLFELNSSLSRSVIVFLAAACISFAGNKEGEAMHTAGCPDPCSFCVASHDKQEVANLLKQHASQVHGMTLTDKEAMAAVKPLEPLYEVACPDPCSFTVQTHDKQEAVKLVKNHARKHHNQTVSDEDAAAMVHRMITRD